MLSKATEKMSAIEEIKARLHKYPHARYEIDGASITVLPVSDNGFTVSLTENPNDYTVSFAGWHEDFQNQDEALNCFTFGLSDDCRLQEMRRGNFAYKWTVEAKKDGSWVKDSTTGLFFFPFWKNRVVRYLQNNLIREAPAGY